MTKLFIGQLHYDATDTDLREALSAAGVVVERIEWPPRARGFVFAFVPDDAVDDALDRIGEIVIGGRQLCATRAHVAAPRPSVAAPRPEVARVFVGRLPRDVSEAELRSHAYERGVKAEAINLMPNQGCALIDVAPRDLEAACTALDGSAMGLAILRAEPARARKRS